MTERRVVHRVLLHLPDQTGAPVVLVDGEMATPFVVDDHAAEPGGERVLVDLLRWQRAPLRPADDGKSHVVVLLVIARPAVPPRAVVDS
ncbi:hypothetical protein ACFCXH_31040 [Streptomyces nojiriensis]|uniref:hypothetical protein n=1 Tax=Streptomyces nojiriensis TaxID=66374 RepID=UPI0035E23475